MTCLQIFISITNAQSILEKRGTLETLNKGSLYFFFPSRSNCSDLDLHVQYDKSIREEAPVPLRTSRCLEEKPGSSAVLPVGWGAWAGSAQPCLQCSARLPPLQSQHMSEPGPCGYFGSAEERAEYFPDLFSPVRRQHNCKNLSPKLY